MRRLGTVTVITALMLPAWVHRAGAVQRLIDVRQIATDTLRDVALATFENGRPVIYYNPVLLQQFGPRLTSFFFAHEYGHIRYGHTGAALAAGEGDLTALRQRQERVRARDRWRGTPVLHPHGPVPVRCVAPERFAAGRQDSRVPPAGRSGRQTKSGRLDIFVGFHDPAPRSCRPPHGGGGSARRSSHLSHCVETSGARAAGGLPPPCAVAERRPELTTLRVIARLDV